MNQTSHVNKMSVTTPSDTEVLVTRDFNAPQKLVFDAWTKPEHVTRWMLGPDGWTMPVCEIDLRPGGDWHFVWRKTDGEEMDMCGTYKEVVPHERLVHTECWGGDWAETLNTMVLTNLGGRTNMAFTIVYPSKEERDRALQTGMNDGMEVSFDRLEEVIGTFE